MHDARLARGRLACGAVGAIGLYVVIDVALVFLRPEFSVLHSAESDYGSAGNWAWLMDLNFVLRCLFSLAVVVCLAVASPKSRRLTAALILLVVWAVASGLLALFPDDPAGTPERPAGRVHLVLALLAFLAVLVGTVLATSVLARQPDRRSLRIPLRIPLLLLSWGAIVPLVLLGRAGFRPDSFGGLYEKAFLALELAWLALAALQTTRVTSPRGRDPERRDGGRGRPSGP